MVGTKTSGRPGGNPDIVNVHKTGPKTLLKKMKVVLSSRPYIKSENSKLLKQIRQCNRCPLGAKEIQVGDKKIMKGAQCGYYERNKKKCPFNCIDYSLKLKQYFEYGNDYDAKQLQKRIALDNLCDAEIAGQIEMAKKGHRGFYTLEFRKAASSNLESIHKMEFGDKVTHTIQPVSFSEVASSMDKDFIDAEFNKEEEKEKEKTGDNSEQKHST